MKFNRDDDEAEIKAILEWRTDHSGVFIYILCDLIRLLINFFHKALSIFFYILPHSNSSKDDESGEVVDGDKDDEGVYSDDDLCTKLCPRDYESVELVQLCESALAHYQAQHPGESYKFESG